MIEITSCYKNCFRPTKLSPVKKNTRLYNATRKCSFFRCFVYRGESNSQLFRLDLKSQEEDEDEEIVLNDVNQNEGGRREKNKK